MPAQDIIFPNFYYEWRENVMKGQEKSLEPGTDGYYRDEKRVTNFLIFLKGIEVELETGKKNYRCRLLIEGRDEVDVAISAGDFNSEQWLKKMPVVLWVDSPGEFCKELRKRIPLMEKEIHDITYIAPRTGFQRVHGRWKFVFSNGSIVEQGFDRKLRAQRIHFMFNGDPDWVDEKETVDFLKILKKNSEFYIIFAVNLLAVTRNLFREMGIDLAISLWLEGSSGSGKTTLAQVFGKFTDPEIVRRGDGNAWHKRSLLSSTDKIPCAVECLTDSHGETVIVDDIKREGSPRQGEKSWTIVDITVRSVYSGYVTEHLSKKQSIKNMQVGTCAIFTGEYRQTEESQNARMLILNVSEFMQKREIRTAISTLQAHPVWHTNLIGGFIRWLLLKANEEGNDEIWRSMMKDYLDENWVYENRSNGQRLKDTRARVRFITKIFGRYLIENFPQEKDFIQSFLGSAQDAIELAVRYTFENLGGMKAVVLEAFQDTIDWLIRDNRIREAAYEKTAMGRQALASWNQESFCFLEWENGQIDHPVILIREFKKTFQNTEEPIKDLEDGSMLVMLRGSFEEKFMSVLKAYVKEGRLAEDEMKRIDLSYLAQLGLIHAWSRTDGIGRYSKKYPVLTLSERNGWNEYDNVPTQEYQGDLREEETISFNSNFPHQ